MNRRMVPSIIAVAITIALLTTACGSTGGTAPAANQATPGQPAKSTEPIKIGYIGNFSMAAMSDGFDAARLAVDEVNAAGGILGRPVELVSEDSKGQTPLSTAAYKKLVMTEGVKYIIAPEGSEVQMAIQEVGAQLYPEYNHILLNIYAVQKELAMKVEQEYDKYKFFFTPYLSNVSYFQFLNDNAKFMTEYTKAKKAALLIEDGAWTQDFRKGLSGKYPPFKEAMEQTGVEVVYYADIAVGEKMFLPIFESMTAQGAEYIYFISAASDNIVFCKQWSQSGAKDLDLYINGNQATMPGFWGMTGGAALGAIAPGYGVRAHLSEKTVPFIDNLKAKYDKEPNSVAFGAYTPPHLIKAAVEKANTVDDIEAVIKALETVDIPGVWGQAVFDKNHCFKWGAPYSDSVRTQFQKDGELVVVYPYETAEKTNPGKTFIPVKELRKAN